MQEPEVEISPPSEPNPAAKQQSLALVGRVLSERYRVDQLLAIGGMGAVYRGEHLLLRKRVAIKVLRAEVEKMPEIVARFEREAIAGAHVQHPNVAGATDFGKLADGSCFLVLEYVKGTTLHEALKRGPFEPARGAKIARQIAAGLGAAHRRGVIHRDVKPRNVMLVEGPEEIAKIIDFGLARIRPGGLDDEPGLDEDARITAAGMVFGTIAYLAPEAALGMDAVDARSDLYALGVVLYKMLAGAPPFEGNGAAGLFAQQRFTPPPSLGSKGARVPPALEAVVMRLLEKEPSQRYQSAEELIAAIDAALLAADAEAARTEESGVHVRRSWFTSLKKRLRKKAG